MIKLFKTAALAAVTAGTMAIAAPASAASFDTGAETAIQTGSESWNHSRDRHYRDRRYYNGNRNHYRSRNHYRDRRVWRGRDGRYYCRRSNGTTGLIIGGAAGALLGRSIDRDRRRCR